MIQGGRGVTALAAVFLWRQAVCDNFVANGYMLNDDGKQAKALIAKEYGIKPEDIKFWNGKFEFSKPERKADGLMCGTYDAAIGIYGD